MVILKSILQLFLFLLLRDVQVHSTQAHSPGARWFYYLFIFLKKFFTSSGQGFLSDIDLKIFLSHSLVCLSKELFPCCAHVLVLCGSISYMLVLILEQIASQKVPSSLIVVWYYLCFLSDCCDSGFILRVLIHLEVNFMQGNRYGFHFIYK